MHGSDDFDWIRSKGSTTSTFTGPSLDHTLGNSQGHYIFIESSAPRVKGDVARLASEIFPPKQTASCLSFFYHMYGADIGSLRVYISTNATGNSISTEAMLWRLDGQASAGNQWQQGQMNIDTIYTKMPYQV